VRAQEGEPGGGTADQAALCSSHRLGGDLRAHASVRWWGRLGARVGMAAAAAAGR